MGTESLNVLPVVTQLVSCSSRIQTQLLSESKAHVNYLTILTDALI